MLYLEQELFSFHHPGPIYCIEFDVFRFECNHFGSFWCFFFVFLLHTDTHRHSSGMLRRDKMRSASNLGKIYTKLFMYGLRNRFVIILLVVVGHDTKQLWHSSLSQADSSTHSVHTNTLTHSLLFVGGDNFHIFTYVMLSKKFPFFKLAQRLHNGCKIVAIYALPQLVIQSEKSWTTWKWSGFNEIFSLESVIRRKKCKTV